MALKKEQIENIIALAKQGELSNVGIAKKVGCSESAVRTTIKKYGVKKNEMKELAKNEVAIHIMENQIKTKKNEFNEKERALYDRTLLSEAQSANLTLNTAHSLMLKMNEFIHLDTRKEKVTVGDGVQKFEDIPLQSVDYVNLTKGVSELGTKMGIFQDKPQIQNINAQSTSEEITVTRISKNA